LSALEVLLGELGGVGAAPAQIRPRDYCPLMPRPTHAVTIDNHTSMQLESFDSTIEDTIKRLVGLVDGDRHFAVSLWRLPQDRPVDRIDMSQWPREYVQTAGTGPDRLTAEIRQATLDGRGHEQFVIGRPGGGSEEPTETISWEGSSTPVRPSEMLTTDEVTALFIHYYQTGTVPEQFTRRALIPPAPAE
jgi:hypothetical protein